MRVLAALQCPRPGTCKLISRPPEVRAVVPDIIKVSIMAAHVARATAPANIPTKRPPADRELITRLVSGHDDAIGSVVDRWSDSFFAFTDALKVFGREADDIIEEVFRRLAFDAPRLAVRPDRLPQWIHQTLRECAASVVARRSSVSPRPLALSAPQRSAPAAMPSAILLRCTLLIEHGQVAAALECLNAATPYRFTGVYRFDGLTLTNLFLYDRENTTGCAGSVNRLADTYCLWIHETLSVVQVSDSFTDPRAVGHPRREQVRSYCGGPVRDERGDLIGTVCHFDFAPHAAASTDTMPILAAVGPLLARVVASQTGISRSTGVGQPSLSAD